MARHYLDHASTTPLRPEARAAMEAWFDLPVGDPSRIHQEGGIVRDALEGARQQLCDLLGVRPRQVVFTSGATEAINAAVWGAAQARPGAPVLCAAVEHSAARDASVRSAPVVEIPVDATGRIDPDALDATIGRLGTPPALVHCQWANHEVGTIQPVAEVAAICAARGVPLHVDAAAAAGHLPLNLGELDATFVSVSAHKLGGPPGSGALVLRRGARFAPLIVGGQQERLRRGGLEDVPGILGFGAAAGALAADDEAQLRAEAGAARAQIAELCAAVRRVEGVSVVGPLRPEDRLPHLLCIGVDGVEAEPVLLGLDRAGIAAHSGSACASEGLEPSPVLAAMGADPSHSLRLSVGWTTTTADVEAFAPAFNEVVARLRALRD